MDEPDDKLRAAMQALEAGVTPRGYFDELPARIDRRLEGIMMADSDHASDPTANGIPPQTEDSGVHDIKALARSTRQRISRRQTSQHDIDVSTSNSGMHAIALPDPAKMIALPTPEEARALSASMSMPIVTAAADDAPASAREPVAHARTRPSKAVPVWLWAGGGVAAAAVAVVAFLVIRQSDREPELAENHAAGELPKQDTVAMREDAPTLPSKAADEGMTVTGIEPEPADVAMGSAAAAAPLEEDKGTAKPAGADARKKEPSGSKSEGGKSKSSEGAATGSGSGSGTSKGSGKTTPPPPPKDDKKVGSGTGTGGAVLGAGDDDELGIGDAIKGGSGGGDKPKKTELTSKELRAGLDAIAGKAKGCYDGAVGTVKVKLTVGPAGSVTKASASGDLAGTPAAACVVGAVKSASFPAWTGAPMSTVYTVLLSD